MRIAAVCTAYHEADILPWTVEHLLAEGIDHVWIECPLGDRETYNCIHDDRVTIIPMTELYHDQPTSIERMAAKAEADWIIPFDADEFWNANSPTQNIRQAIESLDPDVSVLKVGMYQQRDWHWREVPFKPMPKIAYRWAPETRIYPGNHGLAVPPPGEVAYNILTIREIQYRSFEHFCRKVEERNRTLDPNADPKQGIHMTRLKDHSEWKLGLEWEQMNAVPVIWDPIPSSIQPPEHLAPPVENLPMDKLYALMASQPHDIAGHMERLRELSTGKRVLELGVNTGMSTVAFMAGEPELLDSVDIAQPRWRPEVAHDHFWLGDSLDYAKAAPTRPYDVVFIDTDHTMRQTMLELEAYEPKVAPGGCLVLHDTESCPEVALAIQHFIHVLRDKGRAPTKVETYNHSNGLTILWLP